MTNLEYIKWERDEGIGIIYLNNSTEEFQTKKKIDFADQIKQWLSDDIKGLIITEQRKKIGADNDIKITVEKISDLEKTDQNKIFQNQVIGLIENLNIPVLAALDGICFGDVLQIALACDLRFCTAQSVFILPGINRNPDRFLEIINRMEKTSGQQKTMEMSDSGVLLNSPKAFELKIVDRVISEGDFMNHCREYISGLVKNRSAKVIHSIIRSFRNNIILEENEALIKDVEIFCDLAGDFTLYGPDENARN